MIGRETAKFAHIAFYLHAGSIVAVAMAGRFPPLDEWLVPVCVTFAFTASAVHRIRREHRLASSDEADWLGA